MAGDNLNQNEEKWYEFWEKKGYFKADPSSEKNHYSLLMPPPNLTGELHLGHAMQHSIMDAIARAKRMQGYDVLLLPGVDHAGIQFEGTLEKKLAKENLSKRKLGREEWLKKAWEFKEEIYKSFHKTWTVMGISADWSREVFTLEPKVAKAVFEEFKIFWEEGSLYKGAYIVQWCPKCQTAIEDVEMEYEERKEKLYYLKYGPLTLATARPETKFGDTAMAVNPDDKRYQEYIGKEFEIETLAGKKKMKVIADKAVDPKFGTGVIKVTPGHSFEDYEIGKRHNLPVVNVINKEGRLTEIAGKYAGMKVLEARTAMLPELREKGILVKEEDYVHSVPVCERCKTVIEPIISEEWFVKMKPLAKKALENMKKINFFPKNYEEILSDWLEKIHDWSISRSLWWGHRIPVWYCEKCNPNHLVGHPEFSSGSKKEIPKQVRDDAQEESIVVSLKEPNFSCPNCGANNWVQEEKVLDTWFSSGMWPLATLGWQGKTKEFESYFPWNFEISAPEIKYLWIARMVMLSLHFENKIPFNNMFFHGMLRDLQGRKFSKSLGNGIDPLELIKQWGVDSVRMALYTYSIPGRDGRTSRQILDERCKNFRNFGTKIRNIEKFIIELKPEVQNDKQNEDDREILEKLNKLTKSVTKNIDNFNLHLAIDDLYNFVWHDFADEYLEKSKKRRGEAQVVLEQVLKTSLILLHPFMPFLTEELYQKLVLSKTEGLLEHKDSIMIEKWPITKISKIKD
ncbi:valine--tRNA ligase [Candidatus Microgenomates bacterium]|nr:MAG: valine--tRNA ligase [Candidatus Microgenomates bacterium]